MPSGDSSSVLGEMEGLAQKGISAQAPGGGKSQTRGPVSWAGHSPRGRPCCRVSFAIAEFPTVSFCLRVCVIAHLLCTRDLLNRLTEQASQPPQWRGSQDRLTCPPGPELLTAGLLSTQPPQGTLRPACVRAKGAWGGGLGAGTWVPGSGTCTRLQAGLLHG